MELPLFQVDAFADAPLRGNPAAVVPLEGWLDDALMQAIARENNLSETAFLARADAGDADFRLRWFTPVVEVDLCGHATLAAGHVLFRHLGHAGARVRFASRSGPLSVERAGDLLVLDFPALPGEPAEVRDTVAAALGARPREVWRCGRLGERWELALFDREADVRALRPDFRALVDAGAGFVVATAPGDASDIASRVFAPGAGIDEDPVTGAAHCALAPFWSRRLGRTSLRARQVSARGGELGCEVAGDRVRLSGRAVTYLRGTIEV